MEALLITRGDKGMTLVREGYSELHLPTHAREVYDVTGAGDTAISVVAAGLAAGMDLEHATALANIAAGIVVGKFGTATVSPTELKLALGEVGEVGRGLMTAEQLAIAVAAARARSETIVMTVGCFDILHAGHVSYLQNAKKLGSRLVVAVNDDTSVQRLKGAGRPINPLGRRMEVLAGLAAVDWVVPFSKDTPERIICSIKPDILVKGGDYQPEEIAGYECITAAGGKVLVLNFEKGVSTTSIIETIQERGDVGDEGRKLMTSLGSGA
jgi:D-beta-D-heptose 7-phosphate kinase/D-beta-D-heptose 1-phosphate adenosyltransferase